MDLAETMDVIEVPRKARNYLVYVRQVNQTCIGVTAESEDEAREKAESQWRREWAEPEVILVEKCE